jgi:3-oxoacyl-[acyl-carrier-protein] synthase II
MNKKIVITGIGVIAPNGIGRPAFWKALKEGKSGIKPITLFNISKLRTTTGGEVSDFRPEDILGAKGLRNLDRTTKLALCASKLALDDAGIACPIPEEETDLFGVALGSAMGSIWSISEFDKESIKSGPRAVNPALFPNTVTNSPASHISINFNIQGFNSTISTGFCASLDAIYYAVNMIQRYDYKVVLAGGVEELCEQTYRAFHRIGNLAGSRPGKIEVNCPFDRRRNGIALGEGASILVLEELEHARARNAVIYGEILGYGSIFDTKSRNICNPKADGAARAMSLSLTDSGASRIGYISSTANSTLDCDVMETRAIKEVFGAMAPRIPISSIKSMIGESFSAAGAMNVAGALGIFSEGIMPPTINYVKPDKRCDLDYVPNSARAAKVDKILVNCFGPMGGNSSLTIGRFNG